jgi:hypothetical protein
MIIDIDNKFKVQRVLSILEYYTVKENLIL